MTEAELQAHVVELATMLGWTVNHVRRSIGGRKQGWVTSTTLRGWPDLTLIRPPRLVFAELKSDRGRLQPEQAQVLELLAAVPGVETFVWRPDDLDEIAATLNRRRSAGADQLQKVGTTEGFAPEVADPTDTPVLLQRGADRAVSTSPDLVDPPQGSAVTKSHDHRHALGCHHVGIVRAEAS